MAQTYGDEPRDHIYDFSHSSPRRPFPPMNEISDHVQSISASIKGLSAGHVVIVSNFSPLLA